jgi:hypothetical protein
MNAETEVQALIEQPVTEAKPRKRRPRTNVQLDISPTLYRRMRQRASAERRSFAEWLARCAERELTRKPSL